VTVRIRLTLFVPASAHPIKRCGRR